MHVKQQFQEFGVVLATRRARLVLAALALSVVGDGAARIALLLRVHDAGAGPFGLAVMLVVFALPLVLLTGVAGALADRVDPRPVVLTAAGVQLVAALGLAWCTDLVSTGAWVLVLQTGFAIGNSAWVVAIPRLVSQDEVGALVSLNHSTVVVAGPAGAALGGVLVQHVGDSAPFVLDAITFVPLCLAGLLLPLGDGAGHAARRGVLRTVLPIDGVTALRAHPLLAVLAAAVLPFIIAFESVNAVEVFLVKDVLGGTSTQFGLSEALAGVAAVAGALLAASARTTASRAQTILAALVAVSVVQVAQGLAPGLVTFIALAGAVGVLLGVINAVIMTLMVTATDPRTRGRIVALVGGASRSCGMIALAVGGVLGTALGPRGTFVAVGLVGLVIAAAAHVAVRHTLPAEPGAVHKARS